MCRAIHFLAAGLVALLGCQPMLRDNQYRCTTETDCPRWMSCLDGLCTRGGRVDVGVADASSDLCVGRLQLNNGGECRCGHDCPGDAICATTTPTRCTTDCDPVRNQNCRSGEHCVVGTFVGTGLEDQFGTGCRPLQAGDVGAEGDACGGTTPCREGLSCVWPLSASGPLDGECRRVCDVDDPSVCAGRSCTFYRQGRSGRQFGLCSL